jgi:nucleotide-binding universal stress UspA family protein
MRILIAADGSKHGTQDLLSVCPLLSLGKHDCTLLCVAPKARTISAARRISKEHAMKHHHSMQEKLKRRAQRIAESVQAKLAAEGVQAKTMVHCGSPARELIHCAQDFDLLVVGAASHGDASYPGLGSVARRLVEHASSSLLLARERGGQASSRILVPVDGSETAFDVLAQLNDLTDLSGCEVTLLHVVETPWLRLVDDQDWIDQGTREDEEASELDMQADVEREFNKDGEAILEEARTRLPVRTSITTMVNHGIPGDEILSEAASGKYDLVALAASGERDLKHRMLGSVSSKVAWNAPCSVLLAR